MIIVIKDERINNMVNLENVPSGNMDPTLSMRESQHNERI